MEEITLTLGLRGKAYDGPEDQRAYTYDQQPDNLDAWKIGLAFAGAKKTFHADPTDAGLLLLKELQKQGYGVFTLATPATISPADMQAAASGELERAAKDAEIAMLKTRIQDIKECWDWWQEDTYDRCSSVVDDAIRQAIKETSDE